jgi:DNA-binding transcriptional MerR regulator
MAWERRYGWPEPSRLSNGHRAYTEAQADEIALVHAWSQSGMSLRQAIDAVKAKADKPRSARAQTYDLGDLERILEAVDCQVVLLRGPQFIVEYANKLHRRLYPGQSYIGRSALDAFTHSARYFDLAEALRHVSVTGESFSIAEQTVRIEGEERRWTFSYHRLPPRPGGDTRIVMFSREVSDEVRTRQNLEATAERALRAADAGSQNARAFDDLTSVIRRISEGEGATDIELLRLIRDATAAEEASCWAVLGDRLHHLTHVEGVGRVSLGISPTDDLPHPGSWIDEVIERRAVRRRPVQEVWAGADGIGGRMVAAVSAGRSSGVPLLLLLLERPDLHLNDSYSQLLESLGRVLCMGHRQ